MVFLFLMIPVLTLAVVVALDAPAERAKSAGDGPTGISLLDHWLNRLRPWHAAASIMLTGLLLLAIQWHEPELFLLAGLMVLALHVRAWRHEFTLLMALPDDALPGRNDKVVWIVLMVLLPPLGFYAFRSYRAAHLPGLDARWVADTAAPTVKPAPLPEGPWA